MFKKPKLLIVDPVTMHLGAKINSFAQSMHLIKLRWSKLRMNGYIVYFSSNYYTQIYIKTHHRRSIT